MTPQEAQRLAESLQCWRSPVSAEPVGGGMSNRNFRVHHAGVTCFVRIGGDLPEHNVRRADETAVSRAAANAGLSPELLHSEPSAMVFRWIEGTTLTPELVRAPETLPRVAALLQRTHRVLGVELGGRSVAFWVFDVLRDYTSRLGAGRFGAIIDELEAACRPFEIAFCHNDLLPANLIDDGQRLWLVDWEYGGYNAVLFDLAGLASNAEFDEPAAGQLLEFYFEQAVDSDLRRRFAAMTAASLLREMLWSMVAERQSTIEFDFAAYTAKSLARFESALETFRRS
jgi:thiamine kinase-like enzyme